MLQPRLFLLLLVGAIGIVVVFEMGFENKLPGGGFTQSSRPLRERDAVATEALTPSRSSQDVLRQLSTKSLGHRNHESQIPLTDGITNKLASPECFSCLQSKNLTTVPVQTSSTLDSKLTSSTSSVPKRANGGEKRNSFINPAINIGDRLMIINGQHGVSVSRERLDKMLHPILGMPVVKNDSVLRVLVVTYFRAGSTFLGDILQQNWKTFYHFEPLHIMSLSQRINELQSREALKFLSRLFRCDFSNSPFYVKWASKAKHQFLFRHNQFLWATCHLKMKSCFVPDYISEVCRRAPFQVMKVTRVHMHHVGQFLKENRDLNLRVVYLVRDPRGIVNSRKVLEWCNNTSCMDPRELCLEMQHDLEVFRKLQREYRGKLIQVRYEDLALNSSAEAKSLYEALGMPFTAVVQRFIKSHTHASRNEMRNPYSTRRNSSVTAFEWKHKLSFKDIETIQNECSVVMDYLGYKKFESLRDQTDGSFPISRRN